MSFRETLDRHIRAIQMRDLEALMATVADDAILLITPDGRLVRSPAEFAQMHRDWFESGPWTFDATPVSLVESPTLASITFLLDYREGPPQGLGVSQRSLLTLIFELREDSWVMIHDQNTRVQGEYSQ